MRIENIVFAGIVAIIVFVVVWRMGVRPWWKSLRASDSLEDKTRRKPLFAVAHTKDAHAICRWRDYSGEYDSPVRFLPWEQQFLFPRKTFIYSRKNQVLDVHLGDESSYDFFVRQAIESLLGITLKDLTTKTAEEIIQSIFREVDYLFVPYTKGFKGFDRAEQYEYYGKNPSRPDAITYLMGAVLACLPD